MYISSLTFILYKSSSILYYDIWDLLYLHVLYISLYVKTIFILPSYFFNFSEILVSFYVYILIWYSCVFLLHNHFSFTKLYFLLISNFFKLFILLFSLSVFNLWYMNLLLYGKLNFFVLLIVTLILVLHCLLVFCLFIYDIFCFIL